MTRTQRRPPVAILGGGIAGLTAARVLRQHGVPFILYEAGRQLAGMGRSFIDPDGFTYDFGAHFITNRLAAALGIGARCRTVSRYGETVMVSGRLHGYPFGLLSRARFALSGARAALQTAPPARTASQWFERAYGRELARAVAIPIIESWAGVPATQLSPAIGGKLPAGILETMLLKMAAHLTHRAVAIGYCNELPQSPNVWHVYPEGGVEFLCRSLAEGLQDAIRLDSRVESILVQDGRVAAVRAGGVEQEASAVISTAPVHALAAMVEGSHAVRPLARFRYRPMIFVNLRLEGRSLLPDVVLWLPEGFPFFRLTETPLSMPWLAPPDKTLITADIGSDLGDPLWRMSDEDLGVLCVTHLQRVIPDARRRYLGCRVLRTPIAYPIFLNEYEADRQRLARHGTGVAGLYSVGRNGEFAHLLMEDVYWRTHEKMRALLAEGGWR